MIIRVRPDLVVGKLSVLHPTQMTVGRREVAIKRREWSALRSKERKQILKQHWFPVVIGPRQRHYIVDHHHFGLALQEEGVKTVWLMELKDLSWLKPRQFWGAMEYSEWVHPFGADGKRRDFDALPVRLQDMDDDPYRSLAGEVRTAGGFAKDTSPYSEFLWADYFRATVPKALVSKAFERALKAATKLAHHQDARYLPGWVGIVKIASTE
jgi:hypothetical protein